MSGALVLAGGGVAGIAWEVGILLGIEEMQPALAARIFADDCTLIGTSAGSVVASQRAGGVSLRELYDQQFVDEESAIGAVFDGVAFAENIEKLLEGATTALEARQRVGRFAREAATMPASERREVLRSRLTVQHWPNQKLLVTAVDADTGELAVFNRNSGVDLLDALGASCAVPGVWPTVEINGRHYTDGGVRSTVNADLAAGCDPVLILAPVEPSMADAAIPPQHLRALAPARFYIVHADAAARAAFGTNSLDTSTRAASAEAGVREGRRIAAEIAEFWG